MKVYKGTIDSGEMNWEVTVDDKPLPFRLDLANHSPDGFSWGYSGSGCAQLALAMLANHFGDDEKALNLYQDFKFACIVKFPMNKGFEINSDDVQKIVDTFLFWQNFMVTRGLNV